MKKPYIYTLPEAFIKDKSVPTHWRLWALINGFFIAGKHFYATNSWIEEELGVKQWAVSKAFAKLEELELITCERSRNNRIVKPYATFKVKGSDETLPPQCSTTISDSVSSLHNSDSISENLLSESSDSGIEGDEFHGETYLADIDEDGSPQPKSKAKAETVPERDIIAIFDIFGKDSYGLIGKHKGQREAVKALLKVKGRQNIIGAMAFYRDHEGEKGCPRITTPYELSSQWAALARFRTANGL